ncbi:MAG: M48 family metalloprotease [Cyanobium sp.]
MRVQRAAAIPVITVLSLLACGLAIQSLTHRWPSEIRTLEQVLRRLSQGNDLGSQPIAFTVVSGTYTAQLAQQRGLCKDDNCDVFAQLNPYQHYGNGWDELIRQGYAFGDIQAWSVSSGTVMIARPSFRAYGPHQDYLACTVAHEIAHYRRFHIFRQSFHDNHLRRDLSDKARTLQSLKFTRQQELEADRDAADMLLRAGFKGRPCQEELAFMHRSVGDGSITEAESTHPGYEERIAAMRAHYDRILRLPPRSSAVRRCSCPMTQGTAC